MATITITDVREGKIIAQSMTPYLVDARVKAFRAVQSQENLVAAVSDYEGIFVLYYWNSKFNHVSVHANRCAHVQS